MSIEQWQPNRDGFTPIKWDSTRWVWVDAVTDEPLTFDEVEDLGLDGTGRTFG